MIVSTLFLPNANTASITGLSHDDEDVTLVKSSCCLTVTLLTVKSCFNGLQMFCLHILKTFHAMVILYSLYTMGMVAVHTKMSHNFLECVLEVIMKVSG